LADPGVQAAAALEGSVAAAILAAAAQAAAGEVCRHPRVS